MLTVQPASTGDIPVLLHLIHTAFADVRGRLDPPSGAHGESAQSLDALLDQGEHAALARLGAGAVGCIFFVRTGVEMYAHRLAVLPEYRRAGIGRALLTYVEEQARQADCAYVRAGVRLALPGNLAFFARLGYTNILADRHPGYTAPTFGHVVKELGPQQLRVVEVLPYDEQWPARFAGEAAAVHTALGDTVIRIEHIGSTAVPGLAAKPIIDMMPLVRNVDDVGRRITAMAAIGYIPRGEFGLPGRRYFVKRPAHDRRVNCHLYAADHPEVMRHLAFREYLRRHPAARDAYAARKVELAHAHPTDIVAYMDGKDGLIKQIEAAALRWYGEQATAGA